MGMGKSGNRFEYIKLVFPPMFLKTHKSKIRLAEDYIKDPIWSRFHSTYIAGDTSIDLKYNPNN